MPDYRVIDRFLPVLAFLVKRAAIETELLAAVIRKVGKPFHTDKPGFTAEKFSVSASPIPDNRSFPLPRAIHTVLEPKSGRRTFLYGESGYGVSEERQESTSHDQLFQFFCIMYGRLYHFLLDFHHA